MRAMIIPVGGMPYEADITGYEDLKAAVDGFIENVSWVFDDAPSLYINEEGKFTCEPNRAIYAQAKDEGAITWGGKVVHEGDVLDIIYGDFVAIGFNSITGEDRDITDDEIDKVMEVFGNAESINSGLVEALRIQR